ncbi:outer membrane biogenesis protein BamB [Rubripirellula obstinata]|uniref:Outer membrane biogenesis protein BamB n=1 Tax=Rubripirellula obstinata TaxID=406547 RepID=A0A5B1CIF5_9BACT|nr:PQQ-binding-like beta-propeller repeat protein [Rubripirellula obstinata]KAA1260032.1 outer membrane biogenesis protein BamB [Rubripirellula obstinata]
MLSTNQSLRDGLLAIFAISCTWNASAENWPQFRGPHANAVSPTELPTTWSDDEGQTQNIRWKIPVAGEGWSQPIIWEGQVFLTAAVPQSGDAGTQPEPYTGGGGRSRNDLTKTVYQYQVICIDADSGEEVWRTSCKEGPPPIPRHNTNTYATETPMTDGERVYAYFGMNGVYALDMQGNVVWQRDLGVFEMRADWGTSSSPVLFDGKLYVQVDNETDSFLVALDAKTGDEVWKVARDEKSQYSSPMIWQNSQRNELIAGGMVYRSYDPATGELLWQLDMDKGRSSATPVAKGDRLFVGNEFRDRGGSDDGGGRLFCITPGGSGDITPPEDSSSSKFIPWWIERADMQMASPTICDDKIYLFERRTGNMHCVDAATGDTVYRKRVRGAKAFWASPWTDGDKIYALDASGTTHVLGSDDEYELLSANELDEQTWGTPGIADGRIYLRTVNHLYCIETPSKEMTQ